MILRHADVWQAIDQLASDHGFSPSGLARRAGLDPTTFNKSKRISRDGRPRWPSTESIAKILEATGSTLMEFTTLSGERAPALATRLPLAPLDRIDAARMFDAEGRPASDGWDEMSFPGGEDPTAFAVEIGGDAHRPVYRDGDVLIVSPAAEVRRGDRVLVKTDAGELLVGEFTRGTAAQVEIAPFGAASRTIGRTSLSWMSRIVWVTQ